MADNSKRLFKKFSDFKNESKNEKLKEVNPSDNIMPDTDSSKPMNPNTPKETTKGERYASRKNIIPKDQNVDVDTDADDFQNDIDEEETKHESKVETFGKVAKFPKNVKASKAYNFMENVKVSKKSIWYLMIEKDENELQMVKYNYNEGVDLSKFVNDLKTYYLSKPFSGGGKNPPRLKSHFKKTTIKVPALELSRDNGRTKCARWGKKKFLNKFRKRDYFWTNKKLGYE
jgi:hypothetical protein